MARNAEKAQSMLNRWRTMKKDESMKLTHSIREQFEKLPRKPAEAMTVSEAERARMSLLRHIGQRVMEIQNESLGEVRIRDLNDNINRLLQRKAEWEQRIIELGGPNYLKYDRIAEEQDAENVRGKYRYFGAARNLPEVKEMFQDKSLPPAKKSKYDYKTAGINLNYFGYDEENDKTLELIEQQSEQKALERAKKGYEQEQNKPQNPDDQSQIITNTDFETLGNKISLPSKNDIEQAVVEKRKEDLIRKYASDSLISSLETSKKDLESVLGKRKAPEK